MDNNKIIQKQYDDSTVKSLTSLEHIRLRSGMYIGRLGNGVHYDDGIYIMFKEVIDNSIDEFIMGNGKKILIAKDNDKITIRDFGRGIPLNKVIDCVSKINTGAKYNDDVFSFSVGLNGLGLKLVSALSEYFEIISYRDNKFKKGIFKKGILIEESEGDSEQKNGTLVKFIPDNEIFKNKYNYNNDFICKRIKYYSYLNKGLKLIYEFKDKNNNIIKKDFQSKEGIKDLLKNSLDENNILYDIIYFNKDKTLEFALTHTYNFGDTFYSFVNGQYTNNGGTHLLAFKESIVKAINEYSKKSFSTIDVIEGITGAISIKIKDPIFESQTKNKLGNTEIKKDIVELVKNELVKFFTVNPEISKTFINKISNNEKIRKELQSIKKLAREKSKKTALKVPNLRDCKYKRGDKRLKGKPNRIFITEGASASANIISSRNVFREAVFSLKGKPLNSFNMSKNVVYKNAEFYNIVKAIGIEDNIENLKYSEIIFATDSDIDGLHIRNLLITFFTSFYKELVENSHIYILETPLFKVKNKKETKYCYSIEEKNEAIKHMKNYEIVRHKGLGEINPSEFHLFIGDNIRLIQVSLENITQDLNKTLEFYMGKNTDTRRQFIVDNLK